MASSSSDSSNNSPLVTIHHTFHVAPPLGGFGPYGPYGPHGVPYVASGLSTAPFAPGLHQRFIRPCCTGTPAQSIPNPGFASYPPGSSYIVHRRNNYFFPNPVGYSPVNYWPVVNVQQNLVDSSFGIGRAQQEPGSVNFGNAVRCPCIQNPLVPVSPGGYGYYLYQEMDRCVDECMAGCNDVGCCPNVLPDPNRNDLSGHDNNGLSASLPQVPGDGRWGNSSQSEHDGTRIVKSENPINEEPEIDLQDFIGFEM